jgi:DNA-binding HxlR family transcriptional regulator
MSPGYNRDTEECMAVHEVLGLVGDKWSVLVVAHLREGPVRFNALRRAVGDVSKRMLTLTLKRLERDGLVLRTLYPEIPPRVEYELTPLGRSLLEPVLSLAEWAERHRHEIREARVAFDAM